MNLKDKLRETKNIYQFSNDGKFAEALLEILNRLEVIEAKVGQPIVNTIPSEHEKHYFVAVEGDWRCSECNAPYIDNNHIIPTGK
jgi:hypothetical protein